MYPEVFEKRNSSRINYGVALCKFTGVRGKYSSSDASAELVARVRRLFDEGKVVWQMAELGKVDQGGGGTIFRSRPVRALRPGGAGAASACGGLFRL